MSMNTTSRRLVYYIATTVDGYIAHEDESIIGFLAEGHHIADYLNDLLDFDAVLMGRRTYEFGYQYGLQPGQAVPTYSHMAQYVFSRSLQPFADSPVMVVGTDATDFVRDLKQEAGGSIYLCGGGSFASALLAAGLIDEVIVKVNPVLFGRGIPLFGAVAHQQALTLLDSTIYNNGVLFLRYAVE